jgi:K+-sensing histidine kinase KdpD
VSFVRPFPRPASSRAVAATTLEVVLAVAVATGAVAALDTIAPTAGLGVIYLLAVLFVAIRRGELAALARRCSACSR